MRREQIAIGGRQIGYLAAETPVAGARQPPLRTMLFLHAFPLNADMWQPQLAAPPAGWRIVAPDYRGFGESSRSRSESSEITMNDLAGDAIDLLDHLEITEALVAGCSMGGYVAFELFESAPRYVSALVLIDTRAGADSDEGKAGRRGMLDRLANGGAAVIADEMTPKLLGESTRGGRPDLVTQVHRTIEGTNPEAIAMAINAMMNRKDMTALLDRIHVPTLILAGAEDTLIPRASIEDMHQRIGKSRLDTIASAGHLPNLEQPAAFDARLQLFLQDL